jgi:threonylcarbamoyladenosine tRNA methylthiotransferase MtaB
MKVFLDSIGCRLNQSEIERYARQFRAAGHEIVERPDEADLVVVNTCAVTREAASDSRQKIRQAGRNGNARIVVTGCWSTLDPQGAAELPQVVQVVENVEKDHLVSDFLRLPEQDFDAEPLARQPLPGARARTRAFIKVQDGCDNHCTFCVTRIARGKGRSRPLAAVLAEINAAVQGGAREVVLTGVHLGSWGQDFDYPAHLRDLVEGILAHSPVERLRLSSLEPWDLDESFFTLWTEPRLCPHLHLPLQSGCADTLRRMARKTTPDSFAALVEAARRAAPEIAITTDVIVGFPGEREADFLESLAFVERMRFAGGHVFTFSPRPGTAAARLPDQLPKTIRKARNAAMRSVFAAAEADYGGEFIGQTLSVLWESVDVANGQISGLSGNYLRVTAPGGEACWNQISPVRIERWAGDGLFGQILKPALGSSVS